MKAVLLEKYGSPLKLKIAEVDKPVVGQGELLVKVCATSVNDYDWSVVRGKPHIYRLMFGLFKPKQKIAGMEMSGIVEEVGEGVTAFHVGDHVYGDISKYGFGSFAEYISINAEALRHKPANMSFVQAAAIPHAATLAKQGVVDVGKISGGQKILINGAGGGVGTIALQIAKKFGAEVTGVDNAHKLDEMKALGFDEVIDYQKENFTKNGQHYDLILDTKTCYSPFKYLRVLKPEGKYVTVGGALPRLLQLLLLKPFISKTTSKTVAIVNLQVNQDLDYIETLFDSGVINPSIDGSFSLEDVPRAIQYFGEGKHSGKVVVSLEK